MDSLYLTAACQVACTQPLPLSSPIHCHTQSPEPFHTDVHSALTLPLSTNKTKVSRAALGLGGGVSLTYNTCYTHWYSERKKVCMVVTLYWLVDTLHCMWNGWEHASTWWYKDNKNHMNKQEKWCSCWAHIHQLSSYNQCSWSPELTLWHCPSQNMQ